jgi:histidyl-tRNA synthetase
VAVAGVASGIVSSMPSYHTPRGTRDILPSDHAVWTRVETAARDLARRYGYRELDTPLFEQSAVFERGVGAATDIVEKELFRVSPSRGEEREHWALRPEATAGIVRAYVEHGLQTQPQPIRVSLYGPMFRYDRPQAGRYRQFWQWDVEAIGDPGPAVDAEIIELASRFYATVGLTNVEAKLNSIGDSTCRPGYIVALTEYYRPHASALPETERRRLETNPLRLLDSKDERVIELNHDAPKLWDHLCAACSAHFAAVRVHLDALKVPYRLAPDIVRGLDYYSRTTFEFFRPGAEGQQDALGGGGRYDGLVQLLGGKATPAIGFALGIDRVVSAILDGTDDDAARRDRGEGGPLAVVVGADPAATVERLRVATTLRAAGLAVGTDLAQRKLGRQLEAAVKEGARFAIIVGDELADGVVQLRDLGAASQKPVQLSDLASLLRRKAGGG